VAPIADQIQMSVGDVRTLIMDFGNCTEFFGSSGANGINLLVAPVVTISPVVASGPTASNIRQLPVANTDAQPLGILLAITQTEDEPWIGAYYVQMVMNAGAVAGTYVVSVTIQLMDGTVLTRSGTLLIESTVA
jgi:hypothetical protein